jgi:hypothetical protein
MLVAVLLDQLDGTLGKAFTDCLMTFSCVMEVVLDQLRLFILLDSLFLQPQRHNKKLIVRKGCKLRGFDLIIF